MKKQIWLGLFSIILTLLLISLVLAKDTNLSVKLNASEINLSEEAKQIEISLKLIEEDMLEMEANGLSIARYGDTLFLAQEFYEVRKIAEINGAKTDYTVVQDKIYELKELNRKAYINLDELNALNKTIEQITGIDLTPIILNYQSAQKDFRLERYEQSLETIEQTYEDISEAKAFETKLKAFYGATSRGLIGFIKNNWLVLLIVITILTTTALITYKPIIRKIMNRKIKNLEIRKASVSKLISQTQRDYFEKGTIGGENYHIRLKKYSELIRDINRQIPLLKENLAFIGKKQKKRKKGEKDIWEEEKVKRKIDNPEVHKDIPQRIIKRKRVFSWFKRKNKNNKKGKQREQNS